MDRVILHCDLNSFYASVELLDHPELRDRPVAVCGDPNSRHGIILAKNEPAKRYKVQTAETIWQARKKCPRLVLLPAHHDKYREFSRQVNQLYQEYTDLVEPFGIDESWLDITGSLHLFGGDAKALADEIRRVLREELGLTVSVGISFNKIFAKMGSDYKKPDATTVISRENYQELLWPLPITSLLFVGRSAAAALEHYGVHTIGDLARLDREAAASILGRQGCTLHDYATGAEHSPVVPAREQPGPKSVGNGLTFPRNLVGWAELHAGVTELADEVAVRLRGHGLKCTTLQVTIRDPNFKDICRQKRLSAPTYVARELTETAMELIRAAWRENAPVRALTLTAQALVEEGVDAIWYPCMSYNNDEGIGDNHYNCPVVAYYPELLAANVPLLKQTKFLNPYVGLWRHKDFEKRIAQLMEEHFSIPRRETAAAAKAAYAAYDAYVHDVREIGMKYIRHARDHHMPILVACGRPYHIDPEINHGINDLITSFGFVLVTEDALSYLEGYAPRKVLNQWTFQSRMYNAARYVCTQPDMQVVQLVSFGCGTDAITTDELRDILEKGGKLYTQLKIDDISNLGAVKIRIRSLMAAMEARQAQDARG